MYLRKAIPLLLLATTVFAANKKDAHRLQQSAEVLGELMQAEDKAIPQDLFNKAQCAIVVPALKKGAFIFGGKYGRGFASCRMPNGKGWSAPVGVRIEGGTFGFQIGGAEADIIMLVMSHKGMDRLLSSKFTLGGEATAAGGPVGRDTQAQTDVTMRAEILSWSRSRGVFAGIALQGATMRPDDEADETLYGENVDRRAVLEGKKGVPPAAKPLVAALDKYSPFQSK